MKTLLCLCFILIDTITSYPYHGYRSAPQRTVMFGGYYGHPLDTRSYVPQGSMTFASGDTIATNSFVGDQSPLDLQTSVEEFTEKRNFEEVPEVETSTASSKRNHKRKPSNEDDDSEEDMSSSWPFQNNGRNGVPSYNAFFPIMFGGSSGSRKRSGSEEGYYPGSATAIANSFSTGKGGVATSHATSFGDPYSTLMRNGNFNKKAAKPEQIEY